MSRFTRKAAKNCRALALLMLLGPGYASSPALAQLSADQMHASELLQLALDHMREHLQVADGRRVELGKGKMDARLAMPRCATPLVFEAQQQNQRGDRLLVKTSCEDQKRWAVYVPLQYREFAQAVVSTRPIARGKTIEREDIALAEVAVQKTGGNYLPAIDQALGMLATRDVSAGSALQLAALKAPMLVKRGDQVVILAKAGSVQVRMNGTALAAGSADQQIRVKNIRSQRVIKARVKSAGVVEALL